MIETQESGLPLSVLGVEEAYNWSVQEFPCSYLLVVSEQMAGLALRITAVMPRITVSCDRGLGTIEWKLASLSPTLKIRLWHSTGMGQ